MMIPSHRVLTFSIAAAAIVLALVLLLGPTWVVPAQLPDRLPPTAPQRALAVFVLCLGLWVSHVIPLPATSLLAIALLPLFGVMPHSQAFAYFGNSAVFFILGVFLLAAAMIDTGLSKRLTLLFLHRFDRTPNRLVWGVLICGAFFSLWMPEHAVAAMLYPLVLEVTEALELKRPGSIYARSLFLALAWGTMVGGVGTYLGGARAMLAVELYQKFYPGQPTPSFLQYALMTMPTVVVMTAVAFLVITVGARPELETISQATRMLGVRVRALGPLAGRERRLAVLMLATILAWIVVPGLSTGVLGYEISLGVIAAIGGVMVFVLRIAHWKDVQDYVNWGVLIMYGGAVALGAAVADTHAMDWVAANVVPILGTNRFLFAAVVAVAAIFMSEGMSNAAVVSLMLPVAFGLCGQVGVAPLGMMYLVAVPAGLGYCLPMGSPPNAIAFSSGYYGIGAVVSRGMLMNVVSLIVFLLFAWSYWPLVGLKL